MRILIIEDEIFSAHRLKRIVETQGYSVIAIVNNAQDAIAHTKKEHPDIILLDILIKGSMSGAEAAVIIKHSVPQIIIIFLTAYSNQEMIDYASQAKAFGYLLKPYREGEIIATLSLAQNTLYKETQHIQNNSYIELIDGFSFDMKKEKLFSKNKEIPLSKNTRKLLFILCKNKQMFVDTETIIEYIWEENSKKEALRSLIYRLKNLTGSNLILNHHQVGYCIALKVSQK